MLVPLQLCPELAYGWRVMGYFTAVKNLHIREAVCSTSSRPVFGACSSVPVIADRPAKALCDQYFQYLKLSTEGPNNGIQQLQKSVRWLGTAAKVLLAQIQVS